MSNSETNSPLLPLQKHGETEQNHGYNSASFPSGVFSISTSIVGAGIMALPATILITGLIPGLLLIMFTGVLTDASLGFLLKYSAAARATTYSAVVADTFGRTGQILSQICIIIFNFGLLVIYLIIMGDVLSGSTSSSVHHSGVLEEWAGAQTWWNGREIVMLFTIVFVLTPLSFFRHVDSLSLSSALSVVLAIFFVVVTAIVAIWRIFYGTFNSPKLFPDFGDSQYSVTNYFSVVPVLVMAYICHHCVHPILNELEKDINQKSVIRSSLALCASIFMATSVFGYLLFGDDTLSDVLSNFDADLGVPYSKVFADMVRVGYALHIMLVFPLINFSLRLILDSLLFPRAAKPLALDNRRFISLTLCVIGISWVAACYVPDIWDAFQITGSTVAALIAFIIPAILVLRDVHGVATRVEKWVAWFMLILAIVSSVIALAGDIYDYL